MKQFPIHSILYFPSTMSPKILFSIKICSHLANIGASIFNVFNIPRAFPFSSFSFIGLLCRSVFPSFWRKRNNDWNRRKKQGNEGIEETNRGRRIGSEQGKSKQKAGNEIEKVKKQKNKNRAKRTFWLGVIKKEKKTKERERMKVSGRKSFEWKELDSKASELTVNKATYWLTPSIWE